jgi:hypothetical protein
MSELVCTETLLGLGPIAGRGDCDGLDDGAVLGDGVKRNDGVKMHFELHLKWMSYDEKELQRKGASS